MTVVFAMAIAGTTMMSDVIPTQFVGRYEAEASHCTVPLNRRDDDEASTGQGGALVLLRKRSIHFVQWDWPVRSVTMKSLSRAQVELLNDVDANGKKIEIVTKTLTLRGRTLTMSDNQGSQRYYRCSNGI